MSETSISFDKNALIGYLGGNPTLKKYSTSHVILSIITIIEFLSYPNLTTSEKLLPDRFLANVSAVDLELKNRILIDQATELRKLYRLKLPDAVIAATSLLNNCQLVSNDKALDRVPGLTIIPFYTAQGINLWVAAL